VHLSLRVLNSAKKVHRKTRAEQEMGDARKRTAEPRPFAGGGSTVSMLCSSKLGETCLEANTMLMHLTTCLYKPKAQVSKQAVQLWKQIKDCHNALIISIK